MKWYCAKLVAEWNSTYLPGVLDGNGRCVCDWCEARGHCLQVSLAEAEFRAVRLRCVRFDMIEKSTGVST